MTVYQKIIILILVRIYAKIAGILLGQELNNDIERILKGEI